MLLLAWQSMVQCCAVFVMWKSAVYDIYFRTATKTGRMNCSRKWVQCREKRLGTCVWKLRGRRGVERGRGEAVDVMSCLRREFGCNFLSDLIVVNLCAGVDVLLGGGDHPEGSWSPAHCALWAAGPVFVGAILAQPFSLAPCLLFPCFSRLLNVHHSIMHARSMFFLYVIHSPASLAVTSMPSVTASMLKEWVVLDLTQIEWLNWTAVSCSLFVCWQYASMFWRQLVLAVVALSAKYPQQQPETSENLGNR